MCLARWNSPAPLFQALRLPLQVRLATKNFQADNTSAGTVFTLMSGLGRLAVVLKTVESFMDTVKDNMTKGENVYLRGFGSFIIKKRAKKTGRNISKNTSVVIPAHNIPAFKPARDFSNDVKKKVKVK